MINVITPNTIFTNCSNIRCTSSIDIPKLLKNCACEGLNTIYPRKLPKNISATMNIAPINLKNNPASIGFLIFCCTCASSGVGTEVLDGDTVSGVCVDISCSISPSILVGRGVDGVDIFCIGTESVGVFSDIEWLVNSK
jgi:hypothetical protein